MSLLEWSGSVTRHQVQDHSDTLGWLEDFQQDCRLEYRGGFQV